MRHNPRRSMEEIGRPEGPPELEGFKKVFSYYLSGKELPSLKRELARQGFLLFVCFSGGGLYSPLAARLADRPNTIIDTGNYALNRWFCALSVFISATSVLYKATGDFFTERDNETVPAALEDVLTPALTGWEKIFSDLFIVVGSALSALPLAMVSIFYPLIDSIPFIVVQAIIVEFSNTILHFLSLKLALTYPLYRFPILPFEWLIKKCFPSEEVEKNTEAEFIRQRVIAFLERVQQHLESDFCTFDRRTWTYRWEISRELRNALLQNDSGLLLDFSKEFSAARTAPSIQVSKWDRPLCELAGVIGGVWVTGSLAGYFISSVLEIYNWTGSGVGTFFITALPIYFLSVLFSFLGYNVGKMLYQNATHWGPTDNKLPFESKLYPKFFYGMMVFSILSNLYSYAAAEELIHEWVPDTEQWAVLGSLLIWLSRTGIPLPLSINAIKDLAQTFIRKWAIYRGDGDVQLAAELMTSLDQLIFAVKMMNPQVLLDVKSDLVANQIIADFEIVPSTTAEQTEQPKAKPVGWAEWWAEKCCFWWRGSESKERAPLLDSNTEAPEYSSINS